VRGRGRREWRAQLQLTGDPEIDRKNRDDMLDAVAESMRRNRQEMAAELRRSVDRRLAALEAAAGGEEVDGEPDSPADAETA